MIISSFFIPHRIERNRLAPYVRKAGIIFDRCRIAYWSYFAGSVAEQAKARRSFAYGILVDWIDKQLLSRVKQ
jgi:hypothetical protein